MKATMTAEFVRAMGDTLEDWNISRGDSVKVIERDGLHRLVFLRSDGAFLFSMPATLATLRAFATRQAVAA